MGIAKQRMALIKSICWHLACWVAEAAKGLIVIYCVKPHMLDVSQVLYFCLFCSETAIKNGVERSFCSLEYPRVGGLKCGTSLLWHRETLLYLIYSILYLHMAKFCVLPDETKLERRFYIYFTNGCQWRCCQIKTATIFLEM